MTTLPPFSSDDHDQQITHGPLPFGNDDSSVSSSDPLKPPFDPSSDDPFVSSSSPFDRTFDTSDTPVDQVVSAPQTFSDQPQSIPPTQIQSVPTNDFPDPNLPIVSDSPAQSFTNTPIQPQNNTKKVIAGGLLVFAVLAAGGVYALSNQLGLFQGDNRQRAYEPTPVTVTNAAGEQITPIAQAPQTTNIVGKVCGSDTTAGKVFLYNLKDSHVKFVSIDKGSTAFTTTINTNTPYLIFFQPEGSNKIYGYTDSNHQLISYAEPLSTQSLDLELCDADTDRQSIPATEFTLGD